MHSFDHFQVRGGKLVPVFDKLATDVSRWVRNSAFQVAREEEMGGQRGDSLTVEVD
jgi:hypothetical protein